MTGSERWRTVAVRDGRIIAIQPMSLFEAYSAAITPDDAQSSYQIRQWWLRAHADATMLEDRLACGALGAVWKEETAVGGDKLWIIGMLVPLFDRADPRTFVGASPAMDLHGFRPKVAMGIVAQHIKECYKAGVRHVEFIHGHGSGRLGSEVAKVLDEHPRVLRLGSSLGGDGTTGAYLAINKRPRVPTPADLPARTWGVSSKDLKTIRSWVHLQARDAIKGGDYSEFDLLPLYLLKHGVATWGGLNAVPLDRDLPTRWAERWHGDFPELAAFIAP